MAGNDMHKTASGGANPRRSLPCNAYAMAAAGLAIVGGLWYMYNRNRPEARHRVADPDDKPRRK